MMKFPLGNLVITPAVLKAVEVNDICGAINRHVCGQWGDVADADRIANDTALLSGGRLLSSHRVHDGIELRVLAAADRLTTVIYLPDDTVTTGNPL